MDPEHPPATRARARWLIAFSSPLWAGPFLLVQAIRLCASGLLAVAEELRGRPVACPGWARAPLGLFGLVGFPLIVGLRGLLHLVGTLGRWATPRRWRPATRRRTTALHFAVGSIAMLLFPLWLPFALVVWLARWVLWKVLVPEFATALKRDERPRDERMVVFVGLRYLFSERQTALHSATHYFAAGGIALGVCALIVVLAVMSGFDREVRERIVGTNAHVVLLRFGSAGIAHADSLAGVIARHPQTRATAPFVFGKAMLSAGQAAEGALVKGIRWDDERAVTELLRYTGGLIHDPGLKPQPGQLPGMILGKQLVDNLGLFPGDEVVLISPAESRRTPLGFIPRMRRFTLCGVFDSGMYEYDATLAFIDLDEARTFFGLAAGRVTGLEVKIEDMNRAPQVADEMVAMLGGFPYRSNNWIELNSNLFSWMRTEKRAMFVILIMIILVAGFNIASSLIMLVTEKRREIGILMSMGATRAGILRLFVLEGWVMAFAGTALGTALGLGLCHVLETYKLIRLPADIYFIDTLPVHVEWGDIGIIVASVLAIAALSTLFPAWKASRLDPVDAIRSE
jgi:lipoprotein-releasing system permease protein